MNRLAVLIGKERTGSEEEDDLSPAEKSVVTALLTSSAVYDFLLEDLKDKKHQIALWQALKRAAGDFSRLDTWGKMHGIRLSHPLSRLPLVGGRYDFGMFSAAGSWNTVYKSAHSIENRPHAARYGANARHVSDLAQADENYFVLLGGQDGWLGSDNLTDQFRLWQKGEYVRVPLNVDEVKRAFSYAVFLEPHGEKDARPAD